MGMEWLTATCSLSQPPVDRGGGAARSVVVVGGLSGNMFEVRGAAAPTVPSIPR